jgi:hypothetical protein
MASQVSIVQNISSKYATCRVPVITVCNFRLAYVVSLVSKEAEYPLHTSLIMHKN